MFEIKEISYEEARSEYLKEQMQRAQRSMKYWESRIDRSRPHNLMDIAHLNAANAGWKYNFYKDALEALESQQKKRKSKMNNEERKPTGLINSALELRQLIIDNPNLPLLVFAGEDANAGGDFMYNSCSYVNAYVGEFLDCQQTINDEKCYCERDDFEEDLADTLDDYFEESDEAFAERVKQAVAEYDPYWKKCIILYVNN